MLKERVFKIVSQLMEVPLEEVNEDSSPENLEKWDSFHHINLILALEEEFNINFTEEEIFQVVEVGIICETLKIKGVRT